MTILPSVGDPDLNVSFGENSYSAHLLGRDEVLLCPPLASDTVEIDVSCYNSYCSYDVTVNEYDTAIASLTELLSFKRTFDAIQFQIGDGVSSIINSGLPTPSALCFRFDLHSLNYSCGLHVESQGNTVLTFIENGTQYDVTNYTYNGRSYFDVSICDNSQFLSNSSITFQVNTSDIEFSVFVTTSNLSEATPLHTLHLLDGLNILSSEIYLSFPKLLPCGVANVWSSLSSSPFNPPQEFLFSSNVMFRDIAWNLTNSNKSDGNVIYTYLLLDDDLNRTAAEIMRSFSFSVGPGLVDHQGYRLTSTVEIHPVLRENITCDEGAIAILLDDLDDIIDLLLNLGVDQLSDAYSALLLSDIIQSNLTWQACGQQIDVLNGSTKLDGLDVCADEDCTSLFLRNYLKNSQEIEKGACNSTSLVINANIDASWYKGCKESVYSVNTGKLGRPCLSDEDCAFPWGNMTILTYTNLGVTCSFEPRNNNSPPPCDTFLGICGDSQEEAEDLFWWCFVSNMPLDVQLTLSLNSVNACSISDLKSSFSYNDCVSVSNTGMSALQFRAHYTYDSPVSSPIINYQGFVDDPARDHCACFQTIGNKYDLCLDELCNLPPSCEFTSFDHAPNYLLLPSELSSKNDICTYSLAFHPSNHISCLGDIRCNWNPSIKVDSTDRRNCFPENRAEMFCGVHFNVNDVFFHEMVNASQSECGRNGWYVCVSPIGAILAVVNSTDECANVGYCTVECPNERKGWECLPIDRRESSICYNNSDYMYERLCEEMSGQWIGEWGAWGPSMCIFPLQNERNECQRNGNIFMECGSFDDRECASNGFLSCYLSNTSSLCETMEDCEGFGLGRCTDSDYFVNYMTSPPTFGSCVVPFEVDLLDDHRLFCYEHTIPLSLG